MKNIVFACFCPHPPLLLPSVGSEDQRSLVKETIENLQAMGEELKRLNPKRIIISSPHLDWGFNVPLHFLNQSVGTEIKEYLTNGNSPRFHFEKGRDCFRKLENGDCALVGSGDLSHCLDKQGPYGFHPQGPLFDKFLIKYLKERDIDSFLDLDKQFPQAGECGLRSFAFILGILEESKTNWQAKILSYQKPFGVGYLVVKFELN
jgi:aromatic ring-opening dioxygenase LigB subunit